MLVRSPVELVVGTLASLDVVPGDMTPFALASAGMGQNLFSPPNVKGWLGGQAWIDTSTLLARKQFAESIARYDESRTTMAADGMGARQRDGRPFAPDAADGFPIIDVDDEPKARAQRIARALDRAFRELGFSASRWLASLPGDGPSAKRSTAQAILLPIPPAGSGILARDEADALAFVRATLLDPAFQLK